MPAHDGFSGFTDLEQAFFEDGYRMAKEELGEKMDTSLFFSTIMKLYEMLDSFLNQFLEETKDSDHPSHCKKACAFCCHQAVYAQSHEIKYLKHWMFENFNENEIEAVRNKAKQKQNNTRALSPETQLIYKEACPLLINNICSAYAARPIACRIYLSSSLDSCLTEFNNPGHKTSFPQLFDLPYRAGQKLNAGYVTRLQELGMDIEEVRLEDGLGK